MVSSCSCGPILLNGVLAGLAASKPTRGLPGYRCTLSTPLFAFRSPSCKLLIGIEPGYGFQVLLNNRIRKPLCGEGVTAA